jgi:hypothetical protein
MQTMDMSLAQHVKSGRITQQLAFERCHDPEELTRLMGGGLAPGLGGDPGGGTGGMASGGMDMGGGMVMGGM